MSKNLYKLKISYDGTNYFGWQIQPKKPTIQELIQNALGIILKEKTSIFGAGRTDSGVHALEQIAHFSSFSIDPYKTRKSLNGILPKDIRILSLEKEDPSFHARYSAFYKTYLYLLSYKEIPLFLKNYIYHFPQKIDFDLLKKGSTYFLGTHDFTSFANKKCSNKQKIKTVKYLNIKKHKDIIIFQITASGFLYKMARNIIGTLLDIGIKKIDIDQLPDIFLKKDRKKAGRCISSKGLFLQKVHYEKDISFKDSKCDMPFGISFI